MMMNRLRRTRRTRRIQRTTLRIQVMPPAAAWSSSCMILKLCECIFLFLLVVLLLHAALC
jgi:hypothetical protein